MDKFFLQTDIDEILNGVGEQLQGFAGKNILLTGGRGFLGRYFIEVFNNISEKVLKEPCRLIVLDNLVASGEEGRNIPKYKNIEFLQHDVINQFNCSLNLDFIIHAAGIASPFYYKKMPLKTLDVAISGTRNMLELAEINKSRFTFFSSSEIYGDPDPNQIPIKESYRGNVSCQGPRACYDESKRVGETLCDIFYNYKGLCTNTIRPFNIYGPGMQEKDYRVLPNFASRIKSGKPLNVYGTGNQTRTFCYITDAMVGFLLVILNGKPGEAYNIGNHNPEISMLDLVKIIKNIRQEEIKYNKIDYPESYPEDEPTRRMPDLSKANRDLNFNPKIDLKEGLTRFFDWSEKNFKGV